MGDDLTLNQKVVVWARGKLGKKIGRGQCWDLGENALKDAGAQTSNDLGPVGDDIDYVWGDPIKDIKDVQPGDVLQIRDHEVITTTVITWTFPDGSTIEEEDERSAKRGHHTAIVDVAPGPDGVIRTLEQHVKPKGDVVQSLQLYTRSLPTVTTDGVAKKAHPGTKKSVSAKFQKKVTVEVKGTIWPYRPKSKGN